jgi:hypothetical protein
MSAFLDPTDIEQADTLDTLVIAGQTMPGLVDFPTPGDSPRKWDERKGVGLSGATIVFVGLDVAKFTVRLTMWRSEDFKLWRQRRGLVAPPAQGERAKILDFYHPLLEEVGIKACGVTNRTMLRPVSDLGDWYVDISCLGYRKPLPQIGTGNAPKATQYQQTAHDAGSDLITGYLKQLAVLTPKAK